MYTPTVGCGAPAARHGAPTARMAIRARQGGSKNRHYSSVKPLVCNATLLHLEAAGFASRACSDRGRGRRERSASKLDTMLRIATPTASVKCRAVDGDEPQFTSRSGQQSLSQATVVKLPGPEQEVKWGSSLSKAAVLTDAVDEAINNIMSSFGADAKPDFAFVFASSVHGDDFEQVVPLLREKLPSLRTIFGCSGFGVVGGSEDGPVEVEGEHAFSLTLAQLPGTTVKVLHTLRSSIPDENASPEDWAQFVGVSHDCPKPTSFLVFADPRFVQVRDLIAGLDYAFPDSNKIGSILSSGTRSKSRAMWAWSASGPANAAGTGSGSGVARRLGRSGGGVLRNSRRGGGNRGAPAPADMAAAVLAVMGRDAQELQQQVQQQDGPSVGGGGGGGGGRAGASAQESAGSSPGPSGSDVDSGGSDQEERAAGRGGGMNGASTSAPSSSGGQSPGLLNSLGSLLTSIGGRARSGGGLGLGGGRNRSTDSQLSGGAGKAKSMLQAVKDSLLSPLTSEGTNRAKGGAAPGDDAAAVVDVPSNGMYLYGAIVLAMQGQVQLDVITSMGYRAPSRRIWRIETLSGVDHIVTVVPEDVVGGGEAMGGPGNGAGSPSRGRVMSRSVNDSDDDSDDEDEAGGPEVQAIATVVDMLDVLTQTGSESDMLDVLDDWEELLDTAVVAVAADNSKPTSQLGPEDWELLPLQEIVEEYGVLVVGNSPVVGGGVDLRRGNRIQLLVRDPQGVREDLRNSLLTYKRRNLAYMMEGRPLPPTFGALLLTDVDRGTDCYDQPNYESSVAHSYVPTPVSGVFGGAQIAPLQSSNRATAILEYSAVVGVLRLATDPTPPIPPQTPPGGTSALDKDSV